MNFVFTQYSGYPILINLERVTVIKEVVIDGKVLAMLDDKVVDASFEVFKTLLIKKEYPPLDDKKDLENALNQMNEEGEKEEPDPSFHGNTI